MSLWHQRSIRPERQGRFLAFPLGELGFHLSQRPFNEAVVVLILSRLQSQGAAKAAHGLLKIALVPQLATELKPTPAKRGSQLHTALLRGNRFGAALQPGERPTLDVVAEGEIRASEQGATNQRQGAPLVAQFQGGLRQQVSDLRFQRCAGLHVLELGLKRLNHQWPIAAGLKLLPQPLNHPGIAGKPAQTLQQCFPPQGEPLVVCSHCLALASSPPPKGWPGSREARAAGWSHGIGDSHQSMGLSPQTISYDGHGALWLYGLPGSGLMYSQAAGAPSLQELACQEPAAVGESTRIWICYGELADGLADVVMRTDDPQELEAALDQWQTDLSRSAALKRRWRERIQLINICGDGAALLAAELPELATGQRRGILASGVSSGAMELATRALLEARPSLLKAWLDAQQWADASGHAEGVDWRRPMPLARILSALEGQGLKASAGHRQLEERCEQLERSLDLEKEHVGVLQGYLLQMERELDHFLANHERTATLAEQLPQLLERARRLIEVSNSAAPGGHGLHG